jgi:hypothetical protein
VGFAFYTNMKYADKLKHPNWQKMRLKVLQKAKFTCKLCKDTETELHVHHNYYEADTEPWDYPLNAFTCLCKHCHEEVEYRKKIENAFDIYLINIKKVNNWACGDRIMIIDYDGLKYMRIYDINSKQKMGYILSNSAVDAFKKIINL